MDGAPFAGRLDGAALAVDPGAHEFVFQTPGGEPLTKTFVIREGEKDRHEVVVLGPAPAVSTTEPAVGAGGPPGVEGRSRWSGQKTLALVVGGAGVVGLGVGGAFGLAASSQWSQAKQECGGGCTGNTGAQSERSKALDSATASTIAFAAGGAALVGAAVLWFTAPGPYVQLAPVVSTRAAGVAAVGAF